MEHTQALELKEFSFKKIDITKYLDIPYVHEGRSWNGIDCYGLIKLFYAEEFGLMFPEYKYTEDWQLQGFNYIRDAFWSHCRRINQPYRYCLVSFKTVGSKVVDHIGIMLDDSEFLHAQRKARVTIGKLSHPYWAKSFHGFYELKDLKSWQN